MKIKFSKILTVVSALIILAGFALCVRIFLGGPEDSWICSNGEWVKHGAPDTPKPTEPCGDKAATAMTEVKLFYYNPGLDEDASGNILCSRQGIAPVTREIPATATPIKDTVSLLLKGELTDTERADGIETEFPLEGLALKDASLDDDGVLTLTFDDPNNKTSGGACRAGILWFEVEATAEQFAEVRNARFLPEDIFQP